jgi:prepilin-type N-terminal cleavage/methylation domain-containing protein
MDKSFTLIEILVVIVVIGILSSFIVVGISSIISEANDAKGKAFLNSLKNNLLLNIVAEWKFDGPSSAGSDASDADVLDTWLSNDGGVGIHQPTVRSGSDCVSGNCLEFNGVSDYVAVPYTGAFNFGLKLGVFVWVRGLPQTDDKKIIAHYDYGSTNRSWSIGIDDNTFNKLEVIISNDGSNGNPHLKQYYTSDIILDNKWHNVGFTWNGGVEESGGTLKLYIDGKEASVVIVRDDAWVDYALHDASGINLTIGSCLNNGNTNPAYLFNGFIDDIRIFNDIPSF